jgi:hypothetical protein
MQIKLLNKGNNMKCPHCGEKIMNEIPEEAEDMLEDSGIKGNLLDDLISSVGSDDVGQKLEIIIAKKKKKPELETEEM